MPETSPSRGSFLALRAALWATCFVLLWAWVAVAVRGLDARFGVALPGWLGPPGYVLAALGGLLALATVVLFFRVGRGTPAPFDAPREFVVVGPYRYVRNPMYVGGALVLLGAGLGVGSVSICLLSAAFAALAHLFVVLHEEPATRRRFGASYDRYCATVHRWWPARPRRSEG